MFLFHNASVSFEERMLTNFSCFLCYFWLGGKDKQEVFCVHSEVCLQFSPSCSENGTIHQGAVSQLHRCPDYSYPYMAPCEILSVLRYHSSWNWLQHSRTVFCMCWDPTAVMGCLFWHPIALLTCSHNIWAASSARIDCVISKDATLNSCQVFAREH